MWKAIGIALIVAGVMMLVQGGYSTQGYDKSKGLIDNILHMNVDFGRRIYVRQNFRELRQIMDDNHTQSLVPLRWVLATALTFILVGSVLVRVFRKTPFIDSPDSARA